MESQMVNEIGVDMLVAKYALISVEYRSVEAATEFIFGNGIGEPLNHRFFGYIPDNYEAPDYETGMQRLKCFMCEG